VATVAACADGSPTPTAPRAAPSAASADRGGVAADRVTAAALWNLRTRAIIGRRGGNSNAAARTFALVSVAQYDAVIAAEEAKEGGLHPSEAGASAAASAAVLASLYSAEQTFLTEQLAADAAYFPSLPSERDAEWAAGVEVGRAVAAAVLAYGATDGSKVAWAGTVPVGPGYWRPTGTPQDANWGAVRPWTMASGDEFRSAPPPPFGSPEYVTDLAEVHALSDAPTAEQLRIAKFWATEYGPGGPAGYFGTLATELAAGEHMDERRAARMLAVLHTAIMDASIGCYDSKYFYWYVRPYQADATVKTWVTRPNFPSYPSAHSCLSAAAAGVLRGFFPSASDELQAMVEEAGVSRIYAGLHFRFDVTAGQRLGAAVAEEALRAAPEGHRPIPLD
jgi:hypothetical protein